MYRPFYFIFIISFSFIFSCDDGDVFTVEFDFEDTFSACGDSNLVLFKTKSDPAESLSVFISNFNIDDILTFDGFENTIEKSNVDFNYRTYSNNTLPSDLFCSDIPPSNINIINDYSSTTTAVIQTILTEDDNDGILKEFEDINNNGNFDDDDTDGDGIPNYLDADDDGDNVLTKNESPDDDDDGNPQDALDTDGDGTPNYLDDDDDGDNVKTRDEENDNQNQNPTDDITNSDVGADYLNKDVATTVPATAYREHAIVKTYTVTLIVKGISIDILLQDELDFGTLDASEIPSSLKSRTVTPDFN